MKISTRIKCILNLHEYKVEGHGKSCFGQISHTTFYRCKNCSLVKMLTVRDIAGHKQVTFIAPFNSADAYVLLQDSFTSLHKNIDDETRNNLYMRLYKFLMR